MSNSPILARKELPKGSEPGYNVPLTLLVEGGLHRLGEQAPYFSLTYTQHRKGFPNQCWSGGAGHEHILKHFPRFADLAALHLSNRDGSPMHYEANGWYKLAGALGGMGEQYHSGNSKYHWPLPPEQIDPSTPWRTTEYREGTREELLKMFADHCRIDMAEARGIAGVIATCDNPREQFREWIETLKPRWKEQADACIERHNLKEFRS